MLVHKKLFLKVFIKSKDVPPSLSTDDFNPNPTFLNDGTNCSSDDVELPAPNTRVVVLSALTFVVNLLVVLRVLKHLVHYL